MIANQKKLAGVVVAGHQVASGRGASTPYPDSALTLQMPHFQAGGFDISHYYRGTINVAIEGFKVLAVNGEHRFELVEWTPLHPPETFSFSACDLIYNGVVYAGWVYYPHPETKEAHFQDGAILEILTTEVPAIQYGDAVTVVVNAAEVVLVAG